MESKKFQPGDKVASIFTAGLHGVVVGRSPFPDPIWGGTEQYVVQWENGVTSSMPWGHLALVHREA